MVFHCVSGCSPLLKSELICEQPFSFFEPFRNEVNMNKNMKRRGYGFTLVELLVIIGIFDCPSFTCRSSGA